VVHEWLCFQPKEFFFRGIHALLKRWNTCMERNGDYIEKWSHCVPSVLNKLRDKKYLRFSFGSPSYEVIKLTYAVITDIYSSCWCFFLIVAHIHYYFSADMFSFCRHLHCHLNLSQCAAHICSRCCS
jgi:hypothetical protein